MATDSRDPDPVEFEVGDKRLGEENPFADTPHASVMPDLPASPATEKLQGTGQNWKWKTEPLPVSPIPTAEEACASMARLYQEYEDAVARLAAEENAATGDRIALDSKRMRLLANTDPAVMGKNEEQRKAWLYEQTVSMTLQLQARLRSVELLKCEADIARIRCRAADNTLRYIELTIWREVSEDVC